MVMALPATRDLAISPCFHGCLAFLNRHFPPQSPPSHPLHKSLCSEQQPSPWDCSTTPKLQLLACTFQKTGIPVWGMYGCGKDCLMLIPFRLPQTSLVAQSVKNLPAMQEIWVRPLGWEDPLEKEMATHSSILAWKISWREEPGGLQSMGSPRVGHD